LRIARPHARLRRTEAAIFQFYLEKGSLMPSSALPLATRDEYLGGLLDFTGELNRVAVLRATARDVPAVSRARDTVDAVFGQMLQFDLRNGPARRKFDALKYTLKKLESLLYELQLAAPLQSTRMDDEPAPQLQQKAEGADGGEQD
jgi:predicted translin family RNA/ssDNA-binding protein